MKKAALFIANYTIDNSPSILNLIELLADRYHVYLFLHNVSFMKSPVLQNRNVVVINLNTCRTNINALQSEDIPVHIAFDPHGFILCRTIFPECRPFYYSLELYLKNDHFGLDYPDNVRDAERDSINSIRGLIIQSREKELLFREDYGLDPSISTFLLPVTCRKNHSAKKTNFLHQKYRIPEHCRIALHLGGIAAWFSCIELAAAFAAVDGWYLLFQGYADDTYKNELLTMLYMKGITNVIISDEFFDDILDVDKVVACCDLGIAWYNDISEGFRTAGFSSGKIASYMHFGLPVIAKRYASTALSIESPGAGICIDETREIPAALKKISENFAQYSAKAKDTFEHFFNFEKYALSFLEFLQQEPLHLASNNMLASQDYWDSGYRDMKFTLAAHDDPVRRWIERFVPRGHGSCIEIGAFPGRYLAIFGELGYELHGIDLTPRVVSDLPLWLKDCGFKTGSFHQADFISFVTEQQYEIVSSFGFIEHFTNWGDVVTKHAHLVADGGLLIIETPNFSGKLQKHLHTLFDSENMERHCLDAMLPEKWAGVIQQLGFEIIFSGWFGGFDFWSEPANLTMQQADALEDIRRIIPILRTIQEDDPSYSPYCGLIARKLPPPPPIAKAFGNILIACTHFWPSIGGVETIAENLGSQLERMGFCVDVATLADLRRTAEYHRGIRIISLDIHNSTNGLPMWVGQLRNLVTSGNYAACILLADPRNLVIWSVEGAHIPPDTRVIIQPIINDEGYREWSKNSEFRQKLALILKGAAAAVSLTRNGLEASYMREEGVTPVYLPNAVNLVFPEHDFRGRYGIGDNEFLILHVANLWPVKNQPSLIRTVMSLSGDIRLVVIGHPSADADYVAQVREAAAEDPRVVLIPGLAPAHVAAAMAAADVFVLASHGEVSPVTILEAMSHRLPWLATPECGSVHDLAGGIVAPLESFPNIIEYLRTGKDLRRNLGALGYHHWSACYRWEYVAQQWAQLIQQGSVSSSFAEPEDIAIRMKQLKEEMDKGLFSSAEPLVSVIIPTYNRSGMLRGAIQSILNQTLQNFEIIVINDAGEDVSPVVRAFNSSKIVYISHETNKGLAATRNTGIRAARGKYVAYLDDDDIFYPDHLETLVTFLENNDVTVAYTDAYEAVQKYVDGAWVVAERTCTYSVEFDAEALLVNNFTPVLCVMHQRDCLDSTGLFDESLRRHEDWELWIRLSRRFPFAHIKKITCEFSTRDDGLGMREGALPSFLQTYRAVCAKHRGLAEDNPRVQAAQQREVYSLLYRSYQFLLRKIIDGADTSSLTTAGATQIQVQSANLLYNAHMAGETGKKKRFLKQALETDPENVVAREALADLEASSDITGPVHENNSPRQAASIVIVTYNSTATLAACIESVARSLSSRDEVVLVDNASRDETVALTEKLIQGQAAFRIIRNETNAGFSRATNQGILATRNPLVVLLNPDTVVPKEWLNGLSRHMCTTVAAVGPVSNYVAGIQKMELYQPEPLPSQITIDDAAGLFLKWNGGKRVETRLLIGFCMMIRRDALEKIGYLDDELFLGNDDLDVSWRLRLQGYHLMVAPDVFVYHAGQVSFSSEPSETTTQLVQQSTDHLYQKLSVHYAPAPVPPPLDLWGIDWFNPSAEALAHAQSDRLQKTAVDKQLVSIIILTWNQLPFTRACLESISRNTPEPYELIMVDNGSTDGTVPWLREQSQADSRITVIENAENLGFAAGCNQGIRASQGEFILLLNNDTVVTTGWIAGMRELLDRYPDAGIVGPMTNSASGVQVVANPGYRTLDELPAWAAVFRENFRYRIIPQRRIVGFCMLFPRNLVEKIGLLDESFGSGNFEDDDYCLRAELAGFRNMIAGDVFVHHTGGATFTGNMINFAEAMTQNMDLYRKKWDNSKLDEITLRQLVALNAIQEARRLAMRGELDKSIELLMQKGIRVVPDNPAPYRELAEILMAAGRLNDALQVIPEMPPNTGQAVIYELEARCNAALGNDVASEQAASPIQDRPLALVIFGTLATRRNDLTGAEDLFRRAIGTDPSCGSAWLSLGMLLWSQGRQEDAWQAVNRSVVVDPLNRGAVDIFRDMAERTSHLSNALDVIAAALRIYPDSRHLLLTHAKLLDQCGHDGRALETCECFLIHFGVDEQLLDMALGLRSKVGRFLRTTKDAVTVGISLCMIVKNEAANLPKCLASLKPVVDEVIIVDTGSTDRTVDIATIFGAQIGSFAWNGNFSDARNYAIDKAEGRWILIIDADEVISASDHEKIRRTVLESGGKKIAWSVQTRNYTTKVNALGWTANDGTYPNEEAADGWHASWKVRLFPNLPGVRFSGDVHEMVENSLRTSGYTVKKAPFVVHHYGELGEDAEEAAEKRRRYFEIGMKKLEKDPDNKAALSELAVQAGEMGSFEEAIELWNRLLLHLPDNVEALFNKGYCLMGLKRYPEALDFSRRVLELDPAHKEAVFNYGTCELYVGNPSQALTVVAPVAERNPDYPLLQALLGVLFTCTGDLNNANGCFETLRLNGYTVDNYLQEKIITLRSLGRGELAECLINREGWKKA